MTNTKDKKKVIIFDFDGTIYSGIHKFDNVPDKVAMYRRTFLPSFTDEEYERICLEFPNWEKVSSGKDVVDIIYDIKDRYPNHDISPIHFWNWQNESRYDIIIDWNEVVDMNYLEDICTRYTTYVVSNSSPNHLLHYMNVLGINPNWFKGIVSNRFEEYDRTKEHYYRDILDAEHIEASDCYVLGDSVVSDLEPAERLGINTIFISNANDIPSNLDKVLNN